MIERSDISSSRTFIWVDEMAYPVVSRQDICSCQIFLECAKGPLVYFFPVYLSGKALFLAPVLGRRNTKH